MDVRRAGRVNGNISSRFKSVDLNYFSCILQIYELSRKYETIRLMRLMVLYVCVGNISLGEILIFTPLHHLRIKTFGGDDQLVKYLSVYVDPPQSCLEGKLYQQRNM